MGKRFDKADTSDRQDFTQGSIFGKLIQFMIPILGALILQAMYGAVDMLIIGHFGTTAGISAVSTGSSILNMVTFVIGQMAAGVMILLGRYLGERNSQRMGILIGNAIAFFLSISIILTLVLVFFAQQIALLMHAPPEALELTAQYIRMCGIGCIFVVFYNLISSIFRGLGNSRLPLLFVGIACVVNIFGDLLLVAVFKMNVAGAAIATISAQAASVILSLIMIRRQELPFRFSFRDIRFGSEIRPLCKIGVPLALQDLLATVFTSDPQAIAKAFEYLRGLAPEAFLTCILFSFMGYFNGHARSTFVMVQGLIQSFLIRLPISWYMSIQEGASLTGIGLAVPVSTSVGILLCWLYYRRLNRQIQAMHR